MVEGVKAEPGFERAVAAALGWRAGAVVAERIDDAIGMIGAAEGELAIVLAGGRGSGHTPPAAPGVPLTEVCTVHDASLAPLIEGIRLVDDLTAVKSGVAVTVDGTGIDAERGELWRTADAAEAAWLAARAERDRLRDSLPGLAAEREGMAAAAVQAAARLDEALAGEAEVRAALAEARQAETALAQSQRSAAARRDQLADELARCDASRDLAERDLESEAARLAELRASSKGFEAVVAERRAAATEADERHASLDAPAAGWPSRRPRRRHGWRPSTSGSSVTGPTRSAPAPTPSGGCCRPTGSSRARRRPRASRRSASA